MFESVEATFEHFPAMLRDVARGVLRSGEEGRQEEHRRLADRAVVEVQVHVYPCPFLRVGRPQIRPAARLCQICWRVCLMQLWSEFAKSRASTRHR